MMRDILYNRRNVLKTTATAVSIFGAVGTAAGSSSKSNGHEGDPFNPDNKQQVAAFLDKLRETPEAGRQTIVDRLNGKQQAAVLDAMRPVTYRIENTVGIQSTSPPHNISVTASSTLGYDLWTLYNSIDWNVGNVDLPIESDGWLTVSDALYDGKGIVDSQSWVDGWEARKVARVESTFNFDYKGISGGFVATPVVHLSGQSDGGYSVIEKDDGQ